MSMTTVRAYFKSRCEELGRREHKDAFNFANIPSTDLGRAYHVEVGQFRGNPQPQSDLPTSAPVTVRLFYTSARATVETLDSAIAESERLIKATVKASNRTRQAGIKNVVFESMEVGPFDVTNDNALVSTINFTASVLTDVEGV